MSDKSHIQWCDATWSPIRARVKSNAHEIAILHGWDDLAAIVKEMAGRVGQHCEQISGGCNNCYSKNNQHRRLPHNGTGLPFDKRSRELVDIFLDEKVLRQPLGWREPRKIFVENQSDLFGEWIPFEMVDKVFAVMALCQEHTFQVLTKRAARSLEYLTGPTGSKIAAFGPGELTRHGIVFCETGSFVGAKTAPGVIKWPLPNVWLGVSVEDQKHADQRIPLLLQTPAAIRFVSYEPALGPVNFEGYMWPMHWHWDSKYRTPEEAVAAGAYAERKPQALLSAHAQLLKWIIVGGESGQGARPFNVQWARDIVRQCKDSNTACFVKQLGSRPWSSVGAGIKADHLYEPCGHACDCCDGCPSNEGQLDRADHPEIFRLADSKGGDPAEWAEDLRVREFPEVRG